MCVCVCVCVAACMCWVCRVTNKDGFVRPVLLVLLLHHVVCVCVSVCVDQDFEEACSLLEKVGAIQSTQEEILVTEEGHRTLSFLETLLRPFLDAYQVT